MFGIVETYWSLWFRLSGLAVPPPARRAVGGGQHVLVFAAHPDDETLGCGGTIAAHAQAGDSVCVAIVTDGASSRAGGLGRAAMRDVRMQEAAEALAALGVADGVRLGVPEGRWESEAVRAVLLDLIATRRPTVVYAPSAVDFHPEHIRVAELVASVIDAALRADAGTLQCVRAYELQVPLTPILANIAVNTTDLAERRAGALAAYGSQASAVESWARSRRYRRALLWTRQDVELFWEMTPAAYAHLQQGSGAVPPRFRGIRVRPFTDPLAWLVGLRARRRLAYRVEMSVAPSRPGNP